MERHLRAVGKGETADTGEPEKPPPANLVEATQRSRREFLARARLTIAETLDAGPPPHTISRLVAEMERVDAEIRRLDEAERQEAQRRGSGERRSFDSAAI